VRDGDREPGSGRARGRQVTRPLVFVVLAAAVVGAAVLFGDRIPDLDGLRQITARLEAWRAASPLVAALAAFAAYVAVTALSLPLAALMSLGIGALFGFWTGLAIVSFGATAGATLAFLTARHLLRDAVRGRLGERMGAIDSGMARDGAFYLFTLRLIPVVPFFAVNLLSGLTPVRTLTFAWVSLVGMLPGTAVYVNAGTQLAAIDSLSGILTPGLLAALALLGIFPWVARGIVGVLRRRRLRARWERPARFDRNLIVIGAGAAGLVSAYIAATVKAKVTLIEAHRMGGDCLNYGCVPSKALIRSAKVAHQVRSAGRWGIAADAPQVDFRAVMARVHAVIADIAPHDSVERYTALGVEVLQGHARLVDPWTVETAFPDGRKERLTARAIILATGAAPFVPPLPGLAEAGYLTSDTLWDRLADRDAPPRRLMVLGGGPIGCELSQAFARLGSTVTQVEMAPRLLMREDPDVSAAAEAALRADGVTVLTGHRALACGAADGERWIEVDGAGTVRRVPFDEIIVAVGRAARLRGFGLEELGIPAERVIETNEHLETLHPNILVAGDAAGPFQFTHAAGHQAWFAAVNALFGDLWRFRADYRVMPAATFLDPEIARVGLNETEAQARGIAHEVTRYGIDDLDRAIADGAARGFVKVLTAPGSDRILGATIVGAQAGELLAEFVLAMKHGLGLNRILGTIHIYPTMAEANKYVAGEWRRAHVNPRLLWLLERFHGWRRGAR
jgi:pyruvate/2-oxoglutarate dehydrogenase complex dihydrolipoamide dehydrogenase (E3) component/uncharacterized membrane protein YdjX (TVP38/TMEM64 family)